MAQGALFHRRIRALRRTRLQRDQPIRETLCDPRRERLDGHRAICAQLATGGGKTAIAGAIAGGLAQNNHSMLVLVHRRELVDQWAKTLTEVGLGGQDADDSA